RAHPRAVAAPGGPRGRDAAGVWRGPRPGGVLPGLRGRGWAVRALGEAADPRDQRARHGRADDGALARDALRVARVARPSARHPGDANWRADLTRSGGSPMSAEQNKALFRRWLEELSRKNWD